MNLNLLVSIEVFLITMLTVITWNQDLRKLHQCSRENSTIVREVIVKKLMPIFEQHQVAISNECPFHPDRDYLWWPIGDDDRHLGSGWCPFCGFDFMCSDRLTAHWDQEHRETQQETYRDDLVCLADYCDIFRCDVLIRKRRQYKRTSTSNFMGYLRFAENVEYAHMDIQDSAGFVCDPQKMNQLESSCRNVVRQCTFSLKTNSSSSNVQQQQFALAEADLIKSLCSYLSCEHYNSDLFVDESSSRKVPITLFSLLAVILATGFCVCYYFIWTVIQRSMINLTVVESKAENGSKLEDKLNMSFGDNKESKGHNLINTDLDNRSKILTTQHSNGNKSGRFFQNIFEFNQDKNEDTFEFNDFNNGNSADYERKLRSISSIIEEEDEEKGEDDVESDRDLSFNSYPIVNQKYSRKECNRGPLFSDKRIHTNRPNPISNMSTSAANIHSSSSGCKVTKGPSKKQIQEIFLQDLPMKIHHKYIQPVKYSYSDRGYPCYSGPSVEISPNMGNKSRSFSHSQLRNPHNYVRNVPRNRMPQRQDSIEEEWEQKSDNSHSSISIKSSYSASKLAHFNDGRCKQIQCQQPHQHYQQRSRPTMCSSMSYSGVGDSSTYQFGLSSGSNSNASLASRASDGSRKTANSGQGHRYIKR